MNIENKQQNIITFKPIGIVHSPFKEPKNVPRQPFYGKGIDGSIEIYREYQEGVKDLEGFSHIIVLFNFHLSKGYKLQVIPFNGKSEKGLFSTRSPHRPNQIGMSIVRLNRIEDNLIYISNIDIIEGTPVLDIKPFIKNLDCFDDNSKIGWLEKNQGFK